MSNKIITLISMFALSGCVVYPADIEKAERLCAGIKHIRADFFGKSIIARCKDGSTITFDASENK